MTVDTEKKFGQRPDDILERSAGGLEGRAYALSQLAGALEVAQREFEYDGKPLADDLVARCAEFEKYLAGVFITEDAELTTDAECLMCGGEGAYNTRASSNEPLVRTKCEDCGGSGLYRRAD